ncbi:hypothetical protein CR513_29147, partial [Mucuna pruriens]
MVLTLFRIYLKTTKDTNYHLHSDNNNKQPIQQNSLEYSVKQMVTSYGQIPSQTIINPQANKNSIRTIPLPTPRKVVQAKNSEIDDELLQTVNKVKMNIPLFDSIKQIPKYAKFLKELCMNKRKKLKGDVEMGRNVSTLIKSEQVFPDSTFYAKEMQRSWHFYYSMHYRKLSLRLGALEPTSVMIQLANISIAHPLGILDYMLVQDELSNKGPTLILGKLFLKIAKTKIDVYYGSLSMELGDDMVEYNIFEAIKHPTKNFFSIFPIEEDTR